MEANNPPIEQVHPVTFSGETTEYFRIWIVNMALTIVTLGIYSAWAKVRKLRYFYTHTSLADGTFDFHASPKAILIGRIIALAMVLLYFGSGYVSPWAPFVVIILIFALVPLLVVRSRIFRMRNSSYRGVRFNFKKNYSDAIDTYYGGAAVTVISLGFATPTAMYWRNDFAVANSGFGQTNFSFNGESGIFYFIFYKMVGLSILGFFLYFLLMMFTTPFSPSPDEMTEAEYFAALQIFTYIIALPIFAFYAGVGVYLQVRLRNYIWNTTKLGENFFVSTLSVRHMLYLYLTNLLAIVFSIGLLTPWAQIRLAKYRADQTKVVLSDSWESYMATAEKEGSALGDEIGEAFDVDVDIGL